MSVRVRRSLRDWYASHLCLRHHRADALSQIKIKSNALPICYTEEGLEFDDGTHLKADVIIFATGFKGNMRYLVQEIFGDEIAEQMGDYWGLDRYGEIKGAFKPTGREFSSHFLPIMLILITLRRKLTAADK